MNETRRLASFVARTGFDDVPEEVVEHATRMIVDTVGVSLAAVDAECTRIVDRWAASDGGPGGGMASGTDGRSGGKPARSTPERGARVLGTGAARSPERAALVNGTMAHALDFDDVHTGMGGHPSAPVLPAVLAAGEPVDAPGREVLCAFVLGVETELALARVMNPGHYERGWHPTAVYGHVGAAAGAGAVLGLDDERLARAVGIAASQAGGMKGNFGTMTKPYHVGRAARCGVEAAHLAADGFTASTSILEEEFGGYCSLFEGDPPAEFDDHLAALGTEWGILDPPVGFKAYPCCGSTHAPIDAALHLRERHDVDPVEVERVSVTEHPRRIPHTDRPDPEGSLEGKFSVQYVVSVALLDGSVGLGDFADDAVARPDVREFLPKVSVTGDEEAFAEDTFGARVRVTTTSGDTYDHRIPEPVPVDDERLREKYERCAGRALGSDRVEDSLAVLQRFEEFDSVRSVTDALSA